MGLAEDDDDSPDRERADRGEVGQVGVQRVEEDQPPLTSGGGVGGVIDGGDGGRVGGPGPGSMEAAGNPGDTWPVAALTNQENNHPYKHLPDKMLSMHETYIWYLSRWSGATPGN